MAKHDKKKTKDDERTSAKAPVRSRQRRPSRRQGPRPAATVDTLASRHPRGAPRPPRGRPPRRNAAPLGSAEHREAVDELGRIEVRIAAIERAMTPPRG